MSCNCCGEDNELRFCERHDCDICIECIESGNLDSYCDGCDNKEGCKAYEYETQCAKKEHDNKTLEEMCKQISDFLFENYNPYTSVIVTSDSIKVVEDIFGTSIKRP